MELKNVLPVVFLLAFVAEQSAAEVSVVEKKSNTVKPPTTRSLKAPKKKIAVMNEAINQLHIDGYIDRNYVRLVVDVESNNNLTGYIFEGRGNQAKTYVYGQKVNGALHMYDKNGRHLTVVLNK